jgi:hypothetical protein
METYHPHLDHPKRKFKDYLSEFILIFVAITGGFFMENIREKVIDNHKEKEYISRLAGDIKEDTAYTSYLMIQCQQQMKMLDSLVFLLEKPILAIDDKIVTLIADNLNNIYIFSPRDITMSQLKSTGGLRLIEYSTVSDKIVGYYSYIDLANQELVNVNRDFVKESFKEQMNYIDFNQVFKPREMKISKADRMKLANRCFIYKIQVRAYYYCLREIHSQGSSLLKYLNEEYRLK